MMVWTPFSLQYCRTYCTQMLNCFWRVSMHGCILFGTSVLYVREEGRKVQVTVLGLRGHIL